MMKLIIILAVIVCPIVAIASSVEENWLEFKKNHGKLYTNLRDEKLRYEIFKSTLETINNHNTRYANRTESWFMGVNKFSDLTDEEFFAQYLTLQPDKDLRPKNIFVLESNAIVPESIDWRQKGAVLSVKDQGVCGSCWAFSAVGALEGQNFIKHNISVDLSVQELVDCGILYQNLGCKGGWMNFAFDYVKYNGIATMADYPYTGHTDRCQGHSNSGHIKLHNHTEINSTEEDLKAAVGTVGPISVGIDADNIRHYAGGIFNYKQCGTFLNHGVLAVGYGSENSLDYWIIKNSWGSDWGEKGYIKMVRNQDDQCGVALRTSYPNIE